MGENVSEEEPCVDVIGAGGGGRLFPMPDGAWSEFAAGCMASVSFWKSATLFFRSAELRARTGRCFLLNGVILLGSVIVLDRFLLPLLLVLVPINSSQHSETFHKVVGGLLYVLWLYPIYCLSFVINSLTYRKIAQIAYGLTHGSAP